MMSEVATVLVIDDDMAVRRAFRRILESGGLRVLEADDGPSAMQRFHGEAPSAVLLDLRMPGMDGLQVLSELVAESPETPVLVVSGASTMSDVVEALRRGAWDFVSKPVIDPEILVRGVWRGLEKAALLQKNREYAENLRSANKKLSDALCALRADEEAARHLQLQLLPREGLRLGAYSCSRRLIPAEFLSGDFLNYFPLGDHFAGFYVADVAGHGAASAFVTAILTTLVDKYRESLFSRGDKTILDPHEMLMRLDADLTSHRLERHVTMFFGVIDLSSHRLIYANAGAFPFPFLYQRGDVMELECSGRPLNLPGAQRFGLGQITLEPGARLFIASDGVLELPCGGSQREKRDKLSQVTRTATDMEAILENLAIEKSDRPRDDIALLLVKREETHA